MIRAQKSVKAVIKMRLKVEIFYERTAKDTINLRNRPPNAYVDFLISSFKETNVVEVLLWSFHVKLLALFLIRLNNFL